MRRALVALPIIAGLLVAAGSVTEAEEDPVTTDPSLTATPAVGPPSFEFTLTVDDCVDGELIVFSVPDFDNPGSQTEETNCGNGTVTSERTFRAPYGLPRSSFARASLLGVEDELLGGPSLAEIPECQAGREPGHECFVQTAILEVPQLTATPSSGAPGFDFDLDLVGCRAGGNGPVGEDVTFLLPWSDDPNPSDGCDDAGTASANALTAPTAPGEHGVFAVLEGFETQPTSIELTQDPPDGVERCDSFESGVLFTPEPCYVETTITVTQPDTTTSTTTTTTTTTTTVAPPATTAPTTVAPPTTVDDTDAVPPTPQPEVTLPATGPASTGLTGLAALLIVLGIGCLAIVPLRRGARS